MQSLKKTALNTAPTMHSKHTTILEAEWAGVEIEVSMCTRDQAVI